VGPKCLVNRLSLVRREEGDLIQIDERNLGAPKSPFSKAGALKNAIPGLGQRVGKRPRGLQEKDGKDLV